MVGLFALAIFLVALAFFHREAAADTGTGSISLTTLGAAATENFDTLSNTAGSTTNTTLPTGWYITETGGGARDNEQYAVDTGGSTTGDIYSYGAAAATDRALGELRSGTLIPLFGAKFTNNTGATITSLDVAYTGEQWRFGGVHSTVADRLDFQYSVNATDLSTGTYLDANALDFNPPVTTGTAGALDGNAAANRTAISSTITGLSIPSGATFFIRFNDVDATGADDALAVDNFSITPQGAGGGGTTLSINDVNQAETDSGQTAFNFTVSLSAPAGVGGVTFDASTADGTASAGSDFDALTNVPFSITQGNTSTTVTVMVDGDTTPETNETFFVNITNVVGATAGDVQGLGTITNDDVSVIPIHTIQGNGNTSPFAGNAVTTTGIVTGLRTNGFFLQTPDAGVDADPNTSEGIFVFTSSAPPAAAAIGNSVNVSGTVQEFIPAADTSSPPATEIITPTVSLLSTGNPLPAAHTITAAETLVNDLNNLEKYEGMRVHVDSLTAISGTQGTVNEPNATSTTNGVFYGVITGVARPFREPGIELPDPIPTPTPNPNNIPRFDFNPERLRVDSDAQPGAIDLEVSSGEVITNITGVLDYAFRTYTILPDSATPPTAPGPGSAVPIPVPATRELAIATFNMERFFDTTDDPGISDVALNPTAFNNRLNKASLAIRNYMLFPDVIGIEEMENLTTLQAVATKVNNDAVAAAQPNPNYQAFLVEGNDIGGIDVGFLVKSPKISVVDVTQLELAGCDHVTATTCNNYIDPGTGTPAILNDRPPLVLRATVVQPSGVVLPFTVIVVHQRSLSAVDDPTDGNRVRTKRRAQAEFLANYIQSRQVADPTENLVSVGDYNAFNVNDGYVDAMGTVKGTPAPVDQVLLASADLVNPDLTDLGDLTPGAYSYTFDGDAQSLDHVLANVNMRARFSRLAPVHIDSDFPDSYRSDPNRPERISDHDPEVSYFNMAISPSAANGLVSGRVTNSDGSSVSGAVVTLSGMQNRKTISDSDGNYRFDGVETNGFYTVTPTRANYVFSPASRSFSQLGNKTEAAFTGSSSGDSANPLDTAEYFVRQQYVDLLGREPDESGFNYWSDKITQCGSDAGCIDTQRRAVATAFFVEQEFQASGSFIYDVYAGALGRRPAFTEYSVDQPQVVGGANLNAEKAAFAASFVQRAEFVQRYQTQTTAGSFVAALIENAQSLGLDLSDRQGSLLNAYNAGSNTVASRALVLRAIADDASFKQSLYNQAFVLSEYFAYLRRDPDANGYNFWLNVLENGDRGNYGGMVCSFVNSAEYQRRFSMIVSRSSNQCEQ
jgi:predicted extracellular nuclease